MRLRIAILAVLFLSAGFPLLAQSINGCVDTNKGTLRITKAGEPCDAKEYAVSWNTQGLPGKDGKDGANGLNGLPGTNGANGINGRDGTDGRNGKDGQDCVAASPQPPVQVGTISFGGISGGPYPIFQSTFGAQNAASIGSGGGGGAGKVAFSTITIVRKVDSASPTLLYYVERGQHLTNVLITLTPGNAGARRITLESVYVSGYSMTRLEGSEDLFETISLDPIKITIEIDGNSTCWNVATNLAC